MCCNNRVPKALTKSKSESTACTSDSRIEKARLTWLRSKCSPASALWIALSRVAEQSCPNLSPNLSQSHVICKQTWRAGSCLGLTTSDPFKMKSRARSWARTQALYLLRWVVVLRLLTRAKSAHKLCLFSAWNY